MADKPIIFSGKMVRALLDGCKTQTRRVINPPFEGAELECNGAGKWFWWDRLIGKPSFQLLRLSYAPGDRLWVREVWRTMDGLDDQGPASIAASCLSAGYPQPWAPIQYEADGARDNWIADPHTFGAKPGRLRSPLHMPRWASRLTLRLTDVRVERVQEISVEDCKAEGVEPRGGMHGYLGAGYRPAFRQLWEDINGPGAWDRNEWVWVLRFDVIHANVDDVFADEDGQETDGEAA
jgi:hypothetical protein